MIRTIAPNITQTADLDLKLQMPDIQYLDNGIAVYLIHGGTQEVTLFDFDFIAGNVFEEKNLVSGAVSHLLKSGTTTHNAFQLNEAFEYYGAYLNRAAGAEFAHITLHTLNKYNAELLPLVANVIFETNMPEQELDIFKTQRMQQLQMNLQKGDFVANRQIDESIYGANHPYGRKSTVADYEALQIAECFNFYKKFYQNNNFKIFVGGKIPANTVSLLNQYFGQHKTNNIEHIPTFETNTATTNKIELINDANAVQGAIRIARPFYNRHHPDFMEVLVLNTIFGGYFGSRLMNNIREDKGYTYGIHSYIQNHLSSTAWIIATETGKDVTPAAITEIYNEMQNLCTALVDAEELQLVRNYMIGQLLGDLDGPFHLVNRWKTYVHNGVDENYFYTYLNKIRTITPQRIQQLAQQYFTKNDFIELVVY